MFAKAFKVELLQRAALSSWLFSYFQSISGVSGRNSSSLLELSNAKRLRATRVVRTCTSESLPLLSSGFSSIGVLVLVFPAFFASVATV